MFSISAAHPFFHATDVSRAFTGIRYNEAILTFRETTMSFGHVGRWISFQERGGVTIRATTRATVGREESLRELPTAPDL